jgi:hypothetical protein
MLMAVAARSVRAGLAAEDDGSFQAAARSS